MELSLKRMKKIFPTLNEKPLTFDDFYRSELSDVPVKEIKLKKRGYHLFLLKERLDLIFLRHGMNELMTMETLAHEIGHVCGLREPEATAMALIAIIPETRLSDYSWLEENPSFYAKKLWKERLKLKFLYGI